MARNWNTGKHYNKAGFHGGLVQAHDAKIHGTLRLGTNLEIKNAAALVQFITATSGGCVATTTATTWAPTTTELKMKIAVKDSSGNVYYIPAYTTIA
jgi:hypothetical protein